jgi:hypothetical protein
VGCRARERDPDGAEGASSRHVRLDPCLRGCRSEVRAFRPSRARALFGLEFRRQQILGGFVVDFYCAAARLVLVLELEALAIRAVRVVRIAHEEVHVQALRALLAPFARPDTTRWR